MFQAEETASRRQDREKEARYGGETKRFGAGLAESEVEKDSRHG